MNSKRIFPPLIDQIVVPDFAHITKKGVVVQEMDPNLVFVSGILMHDMHNFNEFCEWYMEFIHDKETNTK